MSDWRAQVTLRTVDALPANFITNTWSFGSTTVGDHTAVTTALKDFYDDIPAASISSAVAQNGHTVQFYVLPGVQPNYPFAETTFNLASAPSGTPLPSEVAVCLSFQGTRQAGFPQARRRGRIYLGPLGSGIVTAGRPSPTLRTNMANAALTFKAAIEAITGGIFWAVWSTADQLAVPVDNGWIDDAFDTQRRRGVEVTSRTTWA
jgi:hypothetical protein